MEWKRQMAKKSRLRIPIHNSRILTCDTSVSKLKRQSDYLLKNTSELLIHSVKQVLDIGPLPVSIKKLTPPSVKNPGDITVHDQEIRDIYSWTCKVLYFLLPLFKMKKRIPNRCNIDCSLELYNLLLQFYNINLVDPLKKYAKRLDKYKITVMAVNPAEHQAIMNTFVQSYFRDLNPRSLQTKYANVLANINFFISLFGVPPIHYTIHHPDLQNAYDYPRLSKGFRFITVTSKFKLNLGTNTYTEYKDIVNSSSCFEMVKQ